MAKIPTAEELLEEHFISVDKSDIKDGHYFVIKEAMKEFAKLHVEAALKEASEKAKTKMEWRTDLGGGEHEEVTVNKNSIKKSYPLDNII